jgi:hypothetical protein
MTKKSKAPKATATPHTFMHKTASGNVVCCKIIVPRLGHVSRFEANWERSPTEADLNEQQPWLASVAKTSAAIGGRHLTLRFVDEQGRAVEFPATEAVI